MTPKTGATLAYVTLVTATLGWASTPICLRLLSGTFDPWTVSVYRYGAAFVPVLIVSLIYYRDDLRRLLSRPIPVVALGLMVTVMQYTWTAGTYGAYATTAQLISKLSVVFTILFAFWLFHEERAVIRHPLFLFGTLLSIAGILAVLAKDGGSFAPVVDTAALLLLASSLLWGIYAVWSKHLVADVHPVPLFAIVAANVTGGSAIVAVFFGEPTAYAQITPGMWALTILSGMIPLGLCHPCYNFAQRHLGSSYCSTFILLSPLGTFAAAAIILPEERLQPVQFLGGALLLAGTFAATFAHRAVTAGQSLAEPAVVEFAPEPMPTPELAPQAEAEG